MLVLEVRFHPSPNDRSRVVVVAHVVWSDMGDGHPVVRPAVTLVGQPTPTELLSKLRYLIAATSPDSFDRLQGLRSQFWSFVNVSAQGETPQDEFPKDEKGLS